MTAILFGLMFLAQGQVGMSDDVIKDWKPTAEDRVTPDPSVWQKNAKVAGGWSDGIGSRTNNKIIIGEPKAGKYSFELTWTFCIGTYKEHRTATFVDGVFQLNKPIAGIISITYDRLYPVKFRNETILVPPRNLKSLVESDEVTVHRFAFIREW